ncbi:SRPBCC family protein [Parapedobacter koreensis]|nr:hypothetical protein [Parapedobacter koreensis]
MRKLFDLSLPEENSRRKTIAVVMTVILAGLLTLWGIHGIGEYGIALFLFTPLFIGANPSILYGWRKPITRRDAFLLGLLTLGIFMAGLVLFAIEGLICIAMAAPFALFFMWIGSLIGYAIINKAPNNAPTATLLLVAAIPAMAFVEKDIEPALTSVTTSVTIVADPHTVWENVIAFPRMGEPEEFIFKTGIAYPVEAKIDGMGVGAIRHCNFTTGSFVEPITVWDEPRLLQFDVAEQPATMKELSFWDVDAPHLQDYLVSKKGEFKLTGLPGGNTLLEGTTWYCLRIKPAFYWHLWSKGIIHKIHARVLNHIKTNAEMEAYQIKYTKPHR